jgi:superfamily II DNA/RNA helicase
MAKKLKKSKNTGRSKYPSWLTTDQQEHELRRKRAYEEPMLIKKTANSISAIFTNYSVYRRDTVNPQMYKVEIRSYSDCHNYCNCPDFNKNFLGTCKHIEKVILKTRTKQKEKISSPFIEIYIDYSDNYRLKIELPDNVDKKALIFIKKYLTASKNFKKPQAVTLQVLMRDIENADPEIFNYIRISEGVVKFNKNNILKTESNRIKLLHEKEIVKTAKTGTFLKYPLYDYQIDGMMHLAFSGRALLADEMGLGKTVQAVAASALLKEYFGIKRVLVVSPTSLKTEWEEQVAKFTDFKTHIVLGSRPERVNIYKSTEAFFILTNYEQILRDYEDINAFLQPDLIILDEAQRIKNWKTKTATSIKRLNSKYAFVLTGTPIENRIDELYSLTEFVDSSIFGSLFRFNRKFYNFNEDGKTEGFKNLREMHDTIKPVMIRRRKDEISEQLPERVDNNYFVKMTPEQQKRYEDHAYPVSVLMSIAKHRPLKPKEHEEMQMHLACMRMLCDTCYILDQNISEAPKVDELIKILNDIWENDPDRKVIIFSEWVKMLELVREQLEDNKVKFSWHVGTVPQGKRRDEINNFKNDPEYKVFLSSDSGGLGLNLQVASVVVNMDLPWNPAKLEQRIARAWRKHQKNSVNVINLIAEETIEHRMLATLGFKQGLADGILDGRGDIDEIEKPNAKNKFLERLASIMKTSFVENPSDVQDKITDEKKDTEPEIPKEEIIKQEIQIEKPGGLKICNGVFDNETGKLKTIFAVSENKENTEEKLNKIAAQTNLKTDNELIVINDETYALLHKLSKMGVISFNDNSMKEIYQTTEADKEREYKWKQKQTFAENIFSKAKRSLKMAELLSNGGFKEEAHSPFLKTVEIMSKALTVLSHEELMQDEPANISEINIQQIKSSLKINEDMHMFISLCSLSPADIDKANIDIAEYTKKLYNETNRLIASQGL